jgi:hypothetical protein
MQTHSYGIKMKFLELENEMLPLIKVENFSFAIRKCKQEPEKMSIHFFQFNYKANPSFYIALGSKQKQIVE